MSKSIHIVGICGTFMAGFARLAQALGCRVSGTDQQVYPPMSTQLEQAGIVLNEGYGPLSSQQQPDQLVVGNAISRGNSLLESAMQAGIDYTSGPAWLADNVLKDRWVLAVSGTHGKTTTASMLAWILEQAGLSPGFLIGGVPENFGVSARLGEGLHFVIEADEYDSAFFDKRPKFMHYRPTTLIINNLEFDHADIYSDLPALQQQFGLLLRTVPPQGQVVLPAKTPSIQAVLDRGCWSSTVEFSAHHTSAGWGIVPRTADYRQFDVCEQSQIVAQVDWQLIGQHNASNALAAILAARHVGVPVADAAQALGSFKSVKRRLELKVELAGVKLFDDFAHHPTAMQAAIESLKQAYPDRGQLIIMVEFGAYTLRQGIHLPQLARVFAQADTVLLLRPQAPGFEVDDLLASVGSHLHIFNQVEGMVNYVNQIVAAGDVLVSMSSRGFCGLHDKLIQMLEEKETSYETVE